jgi:ABC-type transporter Mla subunit MlaD
MGLLGDKYIEISAGSPKGNPAHPGELIEGTAKLEFQDVMKTSAITIETMTVFIKKLDGLVTKMEEGQGTFGRLLNDPSVYNSLNKTAQTLSLVAEEIRTSRGTLKILIEDPSLYQKLLAAASHLEEMTRTIKESSGTLKKLIEDPAIYNKLLETASHVEASGKNIEAFSGKLEPFITNLDAFSTKLNESQGTLKKLIEDPAIYNKLLETASHVEASGKNIEAFSGKLEPFITKLDAFSTKLNESQGTLKKLIEDPALYEDLNRGVKQVSSILEQIDKGEGLATAFLRDKELARELSETLVQLKRMTQDIEALAKDIKANPKRYLKFSIF